MDEEVSEKVLFRNEQKKWYNILKRELNISPVFQQYVYDRSTSGNVCVGSHTHVI